MRKPKTEKEIKAEIGKLREIKPFVREFSVFGDSNHEKIDCQIEVPEEDMDEEDIYDTWPDEEGDAEKRSVAQDALNWREGHSEESLSESWSALDSRTKRSSKK